MSAIRLRGRRTSASLLSIYLEYFRLLTYTLWAASPMSRRCPESSNQFSKGLWVTSLDRTAFPANFQSLSSLIRSLVSYGSKIRAIKEFHIGTNLYPFGRLSDTGTLCVHPLRTNALSPLFQTVADRDVLLC